MKNLQKHLATIAKSKAIAGRPVLQHIHYNADSQSIIVTDSHRLLEFNSKETIETTFSIHYQTMQLLDNSITYPNVSRLKKDATITAKIETTALNNALLQLLKVYKKEVVKLSVTEKELTIETDKKQFIAKLPLKDHCDSFEIYFNCSYLIDMLTFIIDYLKECLADSLIMGFVDPVRACFFETENRQFYYLLQPVRMK